MACVQRSEASPAGLVLLLRPENPLQNQGGAAHGHAVNAEGRELHRHVAVAVGDDQARNAMLDDLADELFRAADVAADDGSVRVEQIDQLHQPRADFFGNLAQHINRRLLTLRRRGYHFSHRNAGQLQRFQTLQDAGLAAEFVLCQGEQAPAFDRVQKSSHLAGAAVRAVEQLVVDDEAGANAAGILIDGDVENVRHQLLGAAQPLDAQRAGVGIIADRHRKAEMTLYHLTKRDVFQTKGVRIANEAFARINQARNAEAHTVHLIRRNLLSGLNLLDDPADFFFHPVGLTQQIDRINILKPDLRAKIARPVASPSASIQCR